MRAYTFLAAPFGSVGLVATARGLSHVILTRRHVKAARNWFSQRVPDDRYEADLLAALQRQLREYFDGQPVDLSASRTDLSLLTPFQRRVLQACAKVRYGETVTYGQLARRIGRPRAARAVGAALARNPVPLVIPCHRVVAADGSLGGFSAEQGVSLKRWLLNLEARSIIDR